MFLWGIFTIRSNTNELGLRSNVIKNFCPLIFHQLVVGWIGKAHGPTSGIGSSCWSRIVREGLWWIFTIRSKPNGLGLRLNTIKDLCSLILHQLVVGWIGKAHGLKWYQSELWKSLFHNAALIPLVGPCALLIHPTTDWWRMRGHKSFIAFDCRPSPLVLERIVKIPHRMKKKISNL